MNYTGPDAGPAGGGLLVGEDSALFRPRDSTFAGGAAQVFPRTRIDPVGPGDIPRGPRPYVSYHIILYRIHHTCYTCAMQRNGLIYLLQQVSRL